MTLCSNFVRQSQTGEGIGGGKVKLSVTAQEQAGRNDVLWFILQIILSYLVSLVYCSSLAHACGELMEGGDGFTSELIGKDWESTC